MLTELINDFVSGQTEESDDRTALITFKDSLPDGPGNSRYTSKEEFIHNGRDYIALAYRWYGGENAAIVKVLLSKERYGALWERARKEWAEEREEERKLWERRNEEIRNFRISGPTPFDQIKRNRSVCG